MSDSTLAMVSTLAWIALVGVLLGLFANPDGGAWSIASGVARGVRSWSGALRREQRSPSASSPRAWPAASRATQPPAPRAPRLGPSSRAPSGGPAAGAGTPEAASATAELEDLN